LLKTPDILCANDSRLLGSNQVVISELPVIRAYWAGESMTAHFDAAAAGRRLSSGEENSCHLMKSKGRPLAAGRTHPMLGQADV
jgi:hypothetical protein